MEGMTRTQRSVPGPALRDTATRVSRLFPKGLRLRLRRRRGVQRRWTIRRLVPKAGHAPYSGKGGKKAGKLRRPFPQKFLMEMNNKGCNESKLVVVSG